jgi:hypothetical protein
MEAIMAGEGWAAVPRDRIPLHFLALPMLGLLPLALVRSGR